MATALTPRNGTSRTAVLEARDVIKTYRQGVWPFRRNNPVLTGASLSVNSGEVMGLVGENGSGKSTLMQILVGLLSADAGEVDLHGSIGYCPQRPVVFERLTCDEHFELFGVAYKLTRNARLQAQAQLYEELDFARYAGTRADRLSGGTLAKLNLALALLADPDVLMLDEPYAGFDWDTYVRFWEMMARRRESGRAVLVISHFIADEQRFDRIVELQGGKASPK
ncbi:ATP-binding cassette domain-containing protein [Leifsonia aquatica]|uniref:ABC-type multidrug transport system ATPase subunit n=2 Tax=Leifsonia aquatica TaxID=144185 RepID=A0A7W4YL93_LEIAQ|nr:ABC transporter ATP-binding protein [Leifsonia aquatica]MBB2969262.1 ABC-type multidrug transport system ATPase subunit [Leifsonia aquatica]MBN9630530.1 ABC transporter ATP-binding protein [Actinomycetota bacterium]